MASFDHILQIMHASSMFYQLRLDSIRFRAFFVHQLLYGRFYLLPLSILSIFQGYLRNLPVSLQRHHYRSWQAVTTLPLPFYLLLELFRACSCSIFLIRQSVKRDGSCNLNASMFLHACSSLHLFFLSLVSIHYIYLYLLCDTVSPCRRPRVVDNFRCLLMSLEYSICSFQSIAHL